VPASESHNAAAQIVACVEGLDQWMGVQQAEAERRQDSADLDRYSAAASQADRYSAHAD